MANKTGVNTSTIINIKKQRSKYIRDGNATCSKCKRLEFGYYRSKKKRSAEIGNGKLKCYCKDYIKK